MCETNKKGQNITNYEEILFSIMIVRNFKSEPPNLKDKNTQYIPLIQILLTVNEDFCPE